MMKKLDVFFYIVLAIIVTGCSNGTVSSVEEDSGESASKEKVLTRADIKESSVKDKRDGAITMKTIFAKRMDAFIRGPLP